MDRNTAQPQWESYPRVIDTSAFRAIIDTSAFRTIARED